MIEIAKACTVVLMKARDSLVVQCREKHVNQKNKIYIKKPPRSENVFF